MSQSFYFKDQNVFAEDLNNTESSRIEDVKNRIQNLLGSSGGIYNELYSSLSIIKGGIFGRPDEYTQNKNLKVGLSGTETLFIYPGDAIDVNGNPIRIESTKTVELGGEDSNYIWTPTTGTNYVKLRYMQSSGSVGLDDLGNQYYTRYYDSYYIEIDGTHPSGSTGNPILLGIFTGLGDGSVSIGTLFDRRLYVKVITTADGVIIDPFRNPVPSQTSAADHIAATGSGTPSLNNPHGLSFEDIGGEDVGFHRIQSHINGVIPYDRETSTLNSFKGVVVNNSSPSAAVSFTAPSNAILSVGGRVISSTLPSLTGASAFSLGGNETYAAVVNSSGETSWVLYSTFISNYYDSVLGKRVDDTGVNELITTGHKNSNYYLLGICDVSGGGNTLTFTDTRGFFTTHPKDAIADYKENTSPPSENLTIYSSLEDTLNRIRHQLGIAIAGTGSNWNDATSALTNGPASNADHLHTHSLSTVEASVLVTEASASLPHGTQTSFSWIVETGDPHYGFDNLNLLGEASSIDLLTLQSGVYKIHSSILLTPAGGLSSLFLSSMIYASGSSDIIQLSSKSYDAYSIQYVSVELDVTLQIDTPTSFFIEHYLLNSATSAGTVLRGRLSVQKIGS